jgi:hypothetical protein
VANEILWGYVQQLSQSTGFGSPELLTCPELGLLYGRLRQIYAIYPELEQAAIAAGDTKRAQEVVDPRGRGGEFARERRRYCRIGRPRGIELLPDLIPGANRRGLPVDHAAAAILNYVRQFMGQQAQTLGRRGRILPGTEDHIRPERVRLSAQRLRGRSRFRPRVHTDIVNQIRSAAPGRFVLRHRGAGRCRA